MKKHYDIESIRLEANSRLDPKNKSRLGQFMTTSQIANFMAGLFDKNATNKKLLDCGAGVGSLTYAAVAELGKFELIEAWEIDPIMRSYLESTMQHIGCKFKIHQQDFIHDAVSILHSKHCTGFSHAIINPPYKKINSKSAHRTELRKAGIEAVNLYSAFIALTIMLMDKGGQVVAIIPRSFCNGPYYKPFREQLIRECSIDHIHIFESRGKAFKDDDVLQENIIIKITKGEKQKQVIISKSEDQTLYDYKQDILNFNEIIMESDSEKFIRIPSSIPQNSYCKSFESMIDELNISVSTGPVVDFRMKEFIEQEPSENTVPLLYPHHFSSGNLQYPKKGKKPNALRDEPEIRKWLLPNDGFYVIVKRFSSKEERRRVVAYITDPNEISEEWIGFENHWNVFHAKKHGIDELTAKGLACFLNSTVLDDYFRTFSGHTQVNATDLKNIKYPSMESLRKIGKTYYPPMGQEAIDAIVEGI